MHMSRTHLLGWVFVGIAIGCGSVAQTFDGGPSGDAARDNDSGFVPPFGDASTPDGGADACDPPDMLIVLDRSDSMKLSPDGGDAGPSKWDLAQTAVDKITAPPIDTTLRFGLELLPDQSLKKGDAGSCGSGLLETTLGLSNGAAIASTLSTTDLLSGTPIGGALGVAETTLAGIHQASRAQYVILVTDGNETCDTEPALPVVQGLANDGVTTYVVGFGGKADGALLNDLACAGHTATDFTTSCTLNGAGYVANVPKSTHVFFDAADGPALKAALDSIAGGVCCGCIITN